MKSKQGGKPQFKPKSKNKVHYVDVSKQDNFMFNRTPILASALERIKKQSNSKSQKKNTSSVNQFKRPLSYDAQEDPKVIKKFKSGEEKS